MFLNSMRIDFGSKAYYITKSFINTNREFRFGIARKQFLLNCRSQNYFPKNILNATTNIRKLHFYSNKSKFHMNNMVNKFEHRLRNEEIKDIHYHLNYLNKKLESQKIELKKLLPSKVVNNIIDFQLRLQNNGNNSKEECLNTKLSSLKCCQQIQYNVQLNKHKENSNNESSKNKEYKDPWIVNYSDVQIPENVNDVLRLGKDFNSSFLTRKKGYGF